MPNSDEQLTQEVVVEFCREFLDHPYLCYTEHGQHARFFHNLYARIPANLRYRYVNGFKMCRVQKEYPTHAKLIRPRRQHWDVALIDATAEPPNCECPYDHLPLATVVEFGLNCNQKHIEDDIARLSHPDANIVQKAFIVHLFRLSPKEGKVSARDWSPNSGRLKAREEILPILKNPIVEIYLGVVDSTSTNDGGLWHITTEGIKPIITSRSSEEGPTFPEDQGGECMPGCAHCHTTLS